MMNLLNKLTIKNLKLNRKRTIVTIIGIMLSVALITAVASMYSSGIQSLINYEIKLQGNYHVAYYDVPSSELETFKNNRKIENVYFTKNVGFAKIDSKNEYKPYAFVKEFTKDSLENLSVNLVEGRLPENENEIVIPTHLRTNGRVFLNVGDSITLDIGKRVDSSGNELTQLSPINYEEEDTNTLTESIIDTETKSYKIVGIAERPAKVIEDYLAPGYTFITYLDENKLNGNIDVFVKYNKKDVKNAKINTAQILGIDERTFEKLYNTSNGPLTVEEEQYYSEQINKAKYQIYVNMYLIDLETNPISSGSVGGLGVVVGIVIGIIVVTSVFCIKNSFDISITEKIKQYGMLRSVGATKKQIKKNVFYEATILGTIGIPLGILLGFFASYILVIVSNYFLGAGIDSKLRLVFSFSYIAVLIAIILGAVTIYFSAFKSARRASKVSPLDSIRNSGDIKIKAKKVKSPAMIKKVFGIGGEISFKNLKRNKKKYRTTVISIVVSVIVFIALSSFMGMAFNETENELKLAEYNISLFSYNNNEELLKKLKDTVKLDNIEDYSVVRRANLEFDVSHYNKEYLEWTDSQDVLESGYIDVIAVGKEQYNKYLKKLNLNYDDLKDKAILADYNKVPNYDTQKKKNVYKYMRVFDFKKGDEIKGVLLDNDKSCSLEIGAVVEDRPFGLKNYYGSFVILCDEMYDEQIASQNAVQIFYKSNNANKLQDEIDDYLKGEEYTLLNIDENTKAVKNVFILIGIFLYGFIIVISLIGITNIFNTITTNMELRKPEFAMLKSVGMTTKEFKRMIRLETVFMGVKSLLLGLPVGIGLSYLMYYSFGREAGLPYRFPILPVGITVFVVFVLISLIMRYSMNKINKQNTIETIRNENI